MITTPAPAPPPAQQAPDAPEDPPPWHWIPLGTVVSVLAFALLAQGAAAVAVKILARAFGAGSSPSQVAAVRAANPAGASLALLGAGLVSTATLMLSIALGGYFIGRYGTRTDPRHGMLSGALTATVFWAVTGRHWTILAMIPLGMLAGWASTVGGRVIRIRSTDGSSL